MDYHHPKVKKMVDWASRFARRAILNERPRVWVVLSGKSGCGKSRVARRACRIVRETAIEAWSAGFWAKPPTVAWCDWSKMAEIRDTEEYEGAATDVSEADVVFMDDIGAEVDKYKSGEVTSRMRRLLSALDGKAVMVTTNLKPSEWTEKWDPRVESRMLAAKHLDCSDVPDYRPKIGAKAA